MPRHRDLHAFPKALTFAPTAPAGTVWAASSRINNQHINTMYNTTSINLTSAPVTTETSIDGMSPRYSHITSTRIADTLREAGWEFSQGTTRRARTPERAAHAAHVLRFRNAALPTINGNIIEAVMLNSHDGSTAFQLGFGVYRLACANGLVVCTQSIGSIRMIHSGLNLDAVFRAAATLTNRAPEVAATVERWSNITLDEEQQMSLIRKSLTARWDNIAFADMDAILRPQRAEDTGSDLWTSFNRIQERVLRGGMDVTLLRPIINEDGTEGRVLSRRRATAIRGATKQLRLNETLFQIAESFAA